MRDIKEYEAMTLDEKIKYSQNIIKEYYEINNGMVYVSYSGGKDSTVLLHLVRSVYPDIPGVFINTGAEYPEILDQVKSTGNVVWLEPKKNFRDVVEEYGYPVISKEVSNKIEAYRQGAKWVQSYVTEKSPFCIKSYLYLVDAPFKISNKCCYHLKKAPVAKYERESKRVPIIGTRAEESKLRLHQWESFGEINVKNTRPMCTPMSIWTDEDEWEYVKRFDIKLCDLYYRGWTRTGCAYCMCGIKHNKNKFVDLKKTHPQCWEYAMKPLEEGGLGIKVVCDFLNIPTGEDKSQ